MKQRLIYLITEILRVVFNTIYRKPRYTIGLFFHKRLWKQASYYPEKKQKSSIRIIFEQIAQIWKFGSPNEFYFLYGLDVKYGEEYRSYLHYMPFMRRRDELNQKTLHTPPAALP